MIGGTGTNQTDESESEAEEGDERGEKRRLVIGFVLLVSGSIALFNGYSAVAISLKFVAVIMLHNELWGLL